MPKTRRSFIPKPKNRSSFTVRSLISNRNRNVNFPIKDHRRNAFTTSFASSFVTDEGSSSDGVSIDLFQPTERGKEVKKQKWIDRKSQSVEEWQKLRDDLQETWLTQEAAIEGKACVQCVELGREVIGTIRCKDCGPYQFFCEDCAVRLHSERCCFHLLEKWENGFYRPFFIRKCMGSPPEQHKPTCIRKEKILNLVDDRGIHNEVEFKFCSCETEAATLLRHGFWPFSPQNPQTAISLNLLNIVYLYMMECQVSLKRSCAVIGLLSNPFHQTKVNVPDVYKSLVNNESYQQYCLFRYHLRYKVTPCDPGNVCPACPKGPTEGPTIHSFDACFGLVRKKSSGESVHPPSLEGIFFLPQKNVDDFVESYSTNSVSQKGNKVSSDCNEFHAGEIQSVIRSKGKSKVFDEKAVLGGICRHESPTVGFMNTKAGEKISFSIYYLKNLLNKNSGNVFFIYDIGCILHKHLQNGPLNTMLDQVTLSLPSFLCFGHKYSCQVKYGPKRCKGIGLSDGEAMERLWSYLRRFSAITKEMTASHRIDMLTLCLVHYMERSKAKLGPLLVTRIKRAKKSLKNSEEELNNILATLSGISTTDVSQWICKESTSALEQKDSSNPMSWKENYVSKLLELQELRNEMTNTDNIDSVVVLARTFKKKDAEIKKLEKREKIKKRWLVSDARFHSIAEKVSLQKQKELRESLLKLAQERWFLISLKSKYADGQSIAKKLSKSITKTTKEIRVVVKKFNNNIPLLATTEYKTIDVKSACDPTSPIFGQDQQESAAAFPLSIKRKAMDFYLLAQRSKEEIALLTQEMHQTLSYYNDLKHSLSISLDQPEANVGTTSSLGVQSAIKHQLFLLTNIIAELTHLFSPYIVVDETEGRNTVEGVKINDAEGVSGDEDDFSSSSDDDSEDDDDDDDDTDDDDNDDADDDNDDADDDNDDADDDNDDADDVNNESGDDDSDA